LITHFENDLKTSTTLLTTFDLQTAEFSQKCLEDFKARIVEHVSGQKNKLKLSYSNETKFTIDVLEITEWVQLIGKILT
jgi:hypothetical protein